MVSITRMLSSRATIAAGTSPPRVTHTIASNGPAPLSRQASARASRWNWSHDTGKALSGIRASACAMFMSLSPEPTARRHTYARFAAGSGALALPDARPRVLASVPFAKERWPRFRSASPRCSRSVLSLRSNCQPMILGLPLGHARLPLARRIGRRHRRRRQRLCLRARRLLDLAAPHRPAAFRAILITGCGVLLHLTTIWPVAPPPSTLPGCGRWSPAACFILIGVPPPVFTDANVMKTALGVFLLAFGTYALLAPRLHTVDCRRPHRRRRRRLHRRHSGRHRRLFRRAADDLDAIARLAQGNRARRLPGLTSSSCMRSHWRESSG